jgi:ParB-like chromosome segregation protein Spo0J
MITWTASVRKIKELKEYSKNPRILHKRDEEHIRTSIEKFGMADPVIINLDNTIIGGHQRIRTLKKLKITTTAVMVPDRLLNEDEVAELCIRLNRNHGSFDFDALGNNFEVTELLEWGFNTEELLDGLKTDDLIESEPEEPKKQKTCPHCGLNI